MPEVVQGNSVTLQTTFNEFEGGNPIDPNELMVILYHHRSDIQIEAIAYPNISLVRVGLGVYSYTWDAPVEATPGDYRVEWRAIINGEDVLGIDFFEVVPLSIRAAEATTGQVVVIGEDITFRMVFRDGFGNIYDPQGEIQLDITYLAQIAAGPYLYSEDEITRVSEGIYEFTFTVPVTTTPTFYNAKWTTIFDGETRLDYEQFQVIDPPVFPSSLIDQPRVYGIIRESPLFQVLGVGETDRIFLLGHCDGLNLNDPHQVINMKETMNTVGADSESPLVRGLLEAYNAGARDLWLVSVAPMNEYVSTLPERFEDRDDWGGINFYERYMQRLSATYQTLEGWDLPEIIVPMEAPYYNTGDVDFLTPLVDHCLTAFQNTGAPRIGLMGTRYATWTTDDLEAMAEDSRLGALDSEGGKFVTVIVGEGTHILPQMPFSYTGSLAATAAGMLSSSLLNRGLTYRVFPRVASIVGRDLKPSEIDLLCRARINPLIRTKRGKRGKPFQIVAATDNTLTPEGSDYWSIVQMRLVTKTLQDIRAMGRRSIGTVFFPELKRQINDYLSELVEGGYIRGYDLSITRQFPEINSVLVELSLQPYFGVREIFFQTEIGPGV